MKKIISILLVSAIVLSMSVTVMAENLEDIFFYDFSSSASFGGWANNYDGTASRGVIKDGDNDVYQLKTSRSSYTEDKAPDAVLSWDGAITSTSELSFKLKVNTRGEMFQLVFKYTDTKNSDNNRFAYMVYIDDGKFQMPKENTSQNPTLKEGWNDFKVRINPLQSKYTITLNDDGNTYEGAFPDGFKFDNVSMRFQSSAAKTSDSVDVYIDDVRFSNVVSGAEEVSEYDGTKYAENYDLADNNTAAVKSGWVQLEGTNASDKTNATDQNGNAAKLEIAERNGGKALHIMANTGASLTSNKNVDVAAYFQQGTFFDGEWEIKMDVDVVKAGHFLIQCKQNPKQTGENAQWMQLLELDGTTSKFAGVQRKNFTQVNDGKYSIVINYNSIDNTATISINGKTYIENQLVGQNLTDMSMLDLRIQSQNKVPSRESEYYIDNVSIKYKSAPKIILNGDAVVRVPLGGAYTENSAVVYSNGAEAAGALTITGADAIDTSKTGLYKVTYNAAVGGKAAKPVERKVIVENSARFEASTLAVQDNNSLAYDDKGAFTGAWTTVTRLDADTLDANTYAYNGTRDINGQRAIRSTILRNDLSASSYASESTLAYPARSYDGFYKIDFDMYLDKINETMQVLLRENVSTGAKFLNFLTYKYGTLFAFDSINTGFELEEDTWYGVSLIVNKAANSASVYIDGKHLGTKAIASDYQLSSAFLRMAAQAAEGSAVEGIDWYIDNFKISQQTGAVIGTPTAAFSTASDNEYAEVTLPDYYGPTTVILASYEEGGILNDVDMMSVNVEGLFYDKIKLNVPCSSDANRISVLIWNSLEKMVPKITGTIDKQ